MVSRRAYSVPGPNSLWHIDGHHSLITSGFVIHGCMDGYSRLICFLKCSTNNRKETVEGLFLQSIRGPPGYELTVEEKTCWYGIA